MEEPARWRPGYGARAGADASGVGRAFEGEEAEEEGGLLTMLRKSPAYRRYWGAKVDEDGRFDDQDLLRIARTNALVRIEHLGSVQEFGGEDGWKDRAR